MMDQVLLYNDHQPKCPKCHDKTECMPGPLVKNGSIIADLPKPRDTRRYVLGQLKGTSLEQR